MEPRAIAVGRLRRDAVDHRVRKGARGLDVAEEVRAPRLTDARDRRPRDAAVARKVVAAEDRQRRPAVRAARVEAGGDRLDRRVRLVQRVAALGDRHRKNCHLRVRDLPRECLGVVCGEHVVDDASDDSRTGAVAVALDQRVEVILRLEHAGDATVGVEEPDAANPPVAARFGELVGVQRHVRAMKAADADVQDARAERRAVVVRYGDAATFDCLEVRRRQPKRHAAERTTAITP